MRTNPVVVNSYHNFGVYPDGLGPYLQAVATAPDGSVEAVAHKHLPQWAIMWHPERPPHDPRDGELLRTLFRQPAVGLTPRVLSEFTQ